MTGARIFVLVNGMLLVATVIKRDSRRIHIRYPASIRPGTDGLGFVFSPIPYLKNPILHEANIIMEEKLPEDIEKYYNTYISQLEKEYAQRQHCE